MNLKRNTYILIHENTLVNVIGKMAAIWSRPRYVKISCESSCRFSGRLTYPNLTTKRSLINSSFQSSKVAYVSQTVECSYKTIPRFIRSLDVSIVSSNLRTRFQLILSENHTFSFKKIHLKMSSAKWRQFCFGLNVLKKQFLWHSPFIGMVVFLFQTCSTNFCFDVSVINNICYIRVG